MQVRTYFNFDVFVYISSLSYVRCNPRKKKINAYMPGQIYKLC